MSNFTLIKPSAKTFEREVVTYEFQGGIHTATFWTNDCALIDKRLFEHFQEIGLITYVEKMQKEEDGKMIDVTDIGYIEDGHEMETEFDTHKDSQIESLMRCFLTECKIIKSYESDDEYYWSCTSRFDIVKDLYEFIEGKDDKTVDALFAFTSKITDLPVGVIKERMAFE